MSLRKTIALLSAAPLLLTAAFAHADDADKAKRKERREAMQQESAAHFKAADKDGDGALSKAELAAAPAKQFPNIRDHFDQMDANKDGKVTMAERNTWLKAHP